MVALPLELTTTVLELQRQLLVVINHATETSFVIMETYSDTETTVIALEDLDNIRQRANTYYSRFYTLMVRMAESQPIPNSAMLEPLTRSIEDAIVTIARAQATIREARSNFNLP
ncbi:MULTISPECIES: hypothetical protein [Planktothrix]|uniref:hypothetical protein n=1 Tax=Planktothrix TaxID=54304 RepID=UPI0004123F51|nr:MULTISPECIES: hypothetical protein [Planktothrix]CAD0232158.1 conserved hypothetical protein [Planktothrix agardhii]CAD5979214.1 hypothetical protein NO758_04419 [Planktothrix agardhii]